MEFSIIETLNSQLIVHHPYDNLYDLQSTLQLTKDEMIVMDCIINDQYHTDLILLNPPVIIAVAAVTVALTLQTIWTRKPAPDPSQYLSSFASSYERIGPQNQLSRSKHLASWLAESELDTQAIADCIELIIQYYQISVEQYDDHKCKNSILEAIQACESIDV